MPSVGQHKSVTINKDLSNILIAMIKGVSADTQNPKILIGARGTQPALFPLKISVIKITKHVYYEICNEINGHFFIIKQIPRYLCFLFESGTFIVQYIADLVFILTV
jgi:hypothetical protein